MDTGASSLFDSASAVQAITVANVDPTAQAGGPHTTTVTSSDPTAGAPYPTGTYRPDGTVDLRDTDYPIPADAYFVAPDGSDSNPGTRAAPWATLARAVAAAPRAATIVLRQGVYREGAIDLVGKPLTIQPYPHEKVWLDGSLPVANWAPSGSTWESDGWTHQFTPDAPPQALNPAHPLAGYRDMVFLDGRPLRQVGRLSQVTTGTFFVDTADSRLYLGDDPRGHDVEAAAQPYALNVVAADGTVVRGLGFRYYATSYGPQQRAALRVDAAATTIADNTFAWNATAGLAVYAPDVVVRGNTAAFNGEEGLDGYTADGLLLEDNAIAYNNQEHFATSYEGGGVKVAHSRGMVWRDNLVEANIGEGLWGDSSCYDTTIVRNVVRGNTGSGIHYEISAAALIASNLVVGNGGAGILVGAGSEDVRVYNNTLSRNRWGIRITDDGRTSTKDPRITWDTRNVTVENNLLSNGSDPSAALVEVVDYSPIPKSAEAMNIVLDNNIYYRTSASTPATLVRWSRGSSTASFRSLAAFRAGTGQEAHGSGIDDVAPDPFFVDESGGDYRLVAGSVAVGRGVPLPGDIAAAVGVAAGIPVDVGALKW